MTGDTVHVGLEGRGLAAESVQSLGEGGGREGGREERREGARKGRSKGCITVKHELSCHDTHISVIHILLCPYSRLSPSDVHLMTYLH